MIQDETASDIFSFEYIVIIVVIKLIINSMFDY